VRYFRLNSKKDGNGQSSPSIGKRPSRFREIDKEVRSMEFQDIYNQHNKEIRKYVRHMVKNEWVADDIVQETFSRVMTHLSTVKDVTRLSSWIFRIAHNLCQDYFRSLKYTGSNEHQDLEEFELLPYIPVIKELEQKQMGACIQQQIDLLPVNLKTVLILRDVMEFNDKETAQILDISLENTKTRIHRARKQLKGILQDKCSFEKDERNVLVCSPR
jgi:RNA polymerase sigma-70 factor (ECF subfamily)